MPETNLLPHSSNPEWHSRGYLPHFDAPDMLQHVTFHLADSLPSAVLAELEFDLQTVRDDCRGAERRERIETWIDAGHGSCLLARPEAGRLVQNALLHFDAVRYRLLEWVVMPNHVHVLLEPFATWPLSRVVASWKSFTGRRLALNAPGSGRVWHREYWDRYVQNERHFVSVVEYIRNNPVKAGLVQFPEEWP